MSRPSRASFLAATLTVAIAAAVTTSAMAASNWETPATTLAPYTSGTWDPSVALDRDGDAIALWTSRDPAETPDVQNVYATDHPLGGAWAPLTQVWPGAYAVQPTLAGNADGDAVAAWVGGATEFDEIVHVAERAGATGAWGGIEDFGVANVAQSSPRVAINDRGDAIVVWTERDEVSGDSYVRASSRTGSGSWSEPVTVSDPADAWAANHVSAQIAIDAAGNATALWLANRVADGTSLVQESRFDGSTWSAPRDLASTADYITTLELSGDGHGRLTAAWLLAGGAWVLQGGSFENGAWTISDVSTDVLPTCQPPVAVSVGSDGRSTVAWQRDTSGLSAVTGTVAAWGSPVPIYTPSEDTMVDKVTLAQAAGHEPAVVWTTANSDDWVFGAMGSRRTADGWLAPTTLSTAGGREFSRPSVAMDPAGNALAAWAVYQSYWAKVQVAWAPGAQQPGPTPPAPPAPPAPKTTDGLGVLNPPFVRVRGGMLRLPRHGRTLSARLVNRETVPLRGTARLVHFFGRPAKDGSPMRTIALQRNVGVAVKGKSKLRLKLSAGAIERLRKSRRHAYPVRLYLRLRAPDGRTVRTTQTFTLDGWSRFGKGARQPVARKAC